MAKYKITTIEEKEIDLPEYPFYVKSACQYVKHISENECIAVIESWENVNPWIISRGEPNNVDFCKLNFCTESEFNEKFNEALKIITNVIIYPEKDMIDCFNAGVKFVGDMMNNPSNTEYLMTINEHKKIITNVK